MIGFRSKYWAYYYLFTLFIFLPLLAYGGFRLYRWFNWTFGYESLVRHTIEETVKPECLRR